LLALLDELRARVAAEGDDRSGPARLLELVLDRTRYRAALEEERTIEAAGRLENIAELVGVASGHETLDSLLEEVSLVADADEADPEETKATLMTLHAAEGLACAG